MLNDSYGNTFNITFDKVVGYCHTKVIATSQRYCLKIFSGLNPFDFVVAKFDNRTRQLVAASFPDGTVKMLNQVSNRYEWTQHTGIYKVGFNFIVRCMMYHKGYKVLFAIRDMPKDKFQHRPAVYALLAGVQDSIRQWGNDVVMYWPYEYTCSFSEFEIPGPHQTIVLSGRYTDIMVPGLSLRLYNKTKEAVVTFVARPTTRCEYTLHPNTLLLKSVTTDDGVRHYDPYGLELYDRPTKDLPIA